MVLIAFIVFIAVFAAAILLMMALGTGASKEQKQILERLDSITTATRRRPEDEGLNILRVELLSTVPLVNRWLTQLDLFPKLRQILAQTDLKWTVGGLLLFCLLSGLGTAVAVWFRTGVVLLAAALGALGASGPFLFVLFKRSQRFGAFEQKLPEALDLMVNALRAGHSLISAIEMVPKEMPNPIAEEFKKCFDEQNFGLELREAMTNLAHRVPLHDVQIVVTAILIQKESGGNLAEILEKVATIIRERFRLKRQIMVHTAQGRLTGWILALLPVFLAVALYLIDPHYMSRLWEHPTGLKLMYAACAMITIGALIIRKIIRIQV